MATLAMDRFCRLFVVPIKLFDEVRAYPFFWPPLVAIVFLHVLVGALHFALVDHSYYLADMARAIETNPIIQQYAEIVRQELERSDPTTFAIEQASIDLFVYVLSLLTSAGYLMLAARVCGTRMSLGHWFSLVTWISVIGALSLIARAVAILAAPDGRLGLLDANPLSLSNLAGWEFRNMEVARFDITNAWRWALLCLAYKQWTNVSSAISMAIILVPAVFSFALLAIIFS